MNDQIDPRSTVGQLVKERPARSRVFESFKIDYCCGGALPLEEACAQQGLDSHSVISQLQQADADPPGEDERLVDAAAMTLTELADHIEQTHHEFLRAELPRLDEMTDKVQRVHGAKDPRLAQVRQAFGALRDELTSHMMKEEQILFPLIRQLDRAGAASGIQGESLSGPIRQMEVEHEQAGDALTVLRTATDDFTPPEWACNTYRAMLDGLEHLERDLHQHIHKENNVLFPGAIQKAN